MLVTGAGGIAGVNFVRALKASRRNYYVAGADFSKYYIEFPDVDARHLTPRHDDPSFVSKVSAIARKERVEFIHPQPSTEAFVLSSDRSKLPAPIFLPPPSVMRVAQDKQATWLRLEKEGIPVARTRLVKRAADVEDAFAKMRPPLWVRARHGASGRLSLLCNNAADARNWTELWVRKGTPVSEFIIQEYLPGRNIAWDSIWKDGELITSYCRERLEYPFKHVSPSGITGTPSVARSIHDRRVDKVAEKAVKAISHEPSGAFSIDIKEDARNRPCVTEVDAGKFHSTMALWGYVALRHFRLPWYSNLADLYVRLGLGEEADDDLPKHDLIPAGYYMIRNIDSGVLLWREDGWKERVL